MCLSILVNLLFLHTPTTEDFTDKYTHLEISNLTPGAVVRGGTPLYTSQSTEGYTTPLTKMVTKMDFFSVFNYISVSR